MADVTITGLPNAAALTGTERVPMDQAGTTVDATSQAIANLAPATNLSYDPATGLLSSSTGGDVTLTLADATNPGLLSAAGFSKLASITVDRATLTVATVRNATGSPIAKGTPVYVTGSSGLLKTVAPADASLEATAANTFGVTFEAIGSNANGLVVTEGELSGIATGSLTEGALVFLSETTGGLTSTRPTQPAHGVVIGFCVKQAAGTAGILYVKVDNGLEINELHDVLITSPAAGQVIRRASDGLWKNAQLAAADVSGLGTAALANTGTAAGNVVVLDGSARLPAVDGSQLTGLPGGGSVTSVALSAPTGFSVTGSPITGSGTLALVFASGYSLPTTASQGNWDTAYTDRLKWDGGATGLDAATGRTSLGLGSLATQSGTFSGTSSGTNTGDQDLSTLLVKASNLSDLASASTARTNLGLGTTDAPQFSRLGLGVAAATDLRLAVAGAVAQLRQTVTAASSVYTLDVTVSNEFLTAAAIAGAITINLSNLASIPSGYVWRGVLRFAYTSGTITWFSGNTGYTVKWDGGSAITPTASDQEAVIIEVIGGGSIIEVAALRGRA